MQARSIGGGNRCSAVNRRGAKPEATYVADSWQDRPTTGGGGKQTSSSAKQLSESTEEPLAAASAPEAKKGGGGSGYRGDEWSAPKAALLSSGARETGAKVQY